MVFISNSVKILFNFQIKIGQIKFEYSFKIVMQN